MSWGEDLKKKILKDGKTLAGFNPEDSFQIEEHKWRCGGGKAREAVQFGLELKTHAGHGRWGYKYFLRSSRQAEEFRPECARQYGATKHSDQELHNLGQP